MLLASTLALAVAAAPPVRASPTAPRSDDPDRLLGLVLLGEPPIEEVQRAAAARAAPPREETEGWSRRARLSPLVPELVAEYRHDERALRVSGLTSSSEVDYLRQEPGDTLRVRLSWNLERLVFHRAELEASAAAQRAEARRRIAVERATKLHFERLRMRLQLLASPPPGLERARLELELQQVTAELAALTGLRREVEP